MEYTIAEFMNDFPDDKACMDYIVKAKYGDRKLYPLKDRPKVYCDAQGNQVSPLVGTIFEKSSTSLKLWFYAIFLVGSSRNGVAALELKRQLGVTYKTAWRMMKQIRSGLAENIGALAGMVEIDEVFVGGKAKRKQKMKNKKIVFGMVERKGKVKAKVVPNARRRTLEPIIEETVEKDSLIMSDEWKPYKGLKKLGYYHETVNHSKREYVKGAIHTNTIEGFWGQMKGSIKGTFHHLSFKHLQTYVDYFVFLRNHRKDPTPIFFLILALSL